MYKVLVWLFVAAAVVVLLLELGTIALALQTGRYQLCAAETDMGVDRGDGTTSSMFAMRRLYRIDTQTGEVFMLVGNLLNTPTEKRLTYEWKSLDWLKPPR